SNDEELDRRAGAALLDGAHGDRVRRALLRAGSSGRGLELFRRRLLLGCIGEPLEQLVDVPKLAPQVLAVALEPLDELLAVREPAAPEAVVMMMSTHVASTSFRFIDDNSYLMVTEEQIGRARESLRRVMRGLWGRRRPPFGPTTPGEGEPR